MNAGRSSQVISVVIPAYNEAGTIGDLLAGLHPGVVDGRLEVVVVANGCSDDTASQARAYGGVKVVEIERGHKPTALNEGDRHVASFPRFYVDADVRITADDLGELAGALQAPDVMAVAPALRLDTTGASLLVHSYFKIWQHLPNVEDGLSSRGCYGVSEKGRSRWTSFPDLVNDDRFAHSRFTAEERRVVPEVVSLVRAPETARAAIARRARVQVGLDQLSSLLDRQKEVSDPTGWVEVVRSRPNLLVHIPAYLALTLLARIKARKSAGLPTEEVWASSAGRSNG